MATATARRCAFRTSQTFIDCVEDIRSAGFVNGKQSVSLILFRQPGANIIDTVNKIQEALPALEASIPSAMNLMTVLDRTTTIRASVFEVERTLVISISLVILVVFLFLRRVRATLIPAATAIANDQDLAKR